MILSVELGSFHFHRYQAELETIYKGLKHWVWGTKLRQLISVRGCPYSPYGSQQHKGQQPPGGTRDAGILELVIIPDK